MIIIAGGMSELVVEWVRVNQEVSTWSAEAYQVVQRVKYIIVIVCLGHIEVYI